MFFSTVTRRAVPSKRVASKDNRVSGVPISSISAVAHMLLPESGSALEVNSVVHDKTPGHPVRNAFVLRSFLLATALWAPERDADLVRIRSLSRKKR